MNTAQLIGDSLCTGAIATVATTAAVAAAGTVEREGPLGPINAVSHIAWGDEAATHDEASLKYTGAGLALNATAVTGWAAVHELLCGRAVDKGGVTAALISGAAVSAMAYVTDYYIVPSRFTPGFEKRLSNRALFGIYSVLAVSLALGSLCRGRSRELNEYDATFAG